MLKLITGRAGRGKTARIYDAIKARTLMREAGQLLIVPEQYSHAAERELCARCGDTVSLYSEVLSFSRLADRVFSELGGQAEGVLDQGGRILTMRLAVTEVQSRLKRLAFSQKPQLLEHLLAVADELKCCMVTPAMLEEAADRASAPLGEKLADLALICAAYDAESFRRDPRDKLTRLSEALPDSQIGASGHIYIDGFTDFTNQEMAVIQALLDKNAALTLALTCDGLYGDAEIFERARQTASRLRRAAADRGIPVEIEAVDGEMDDRTPALSFLEAHLFDGVQAAFDGDAGEIRVIRAKTPVEECELAAAVTLSLVQERGCRYRDVGVVARGFSDYETAAEQVFQRAGIPVYVSRTADIMQKPILLLITSALEAILGGFRYEAVFRYLKTGLAGLSLSDCDLLENYVLTWGISGHLWKRADPWTLPPGGYGAQTDAQADALLAQINDIRDRAAAPLLKLARAGKRAETAAEQAQALYAFLEDIGLPARLREKAADLARTGRAQLAAEYDQIWRVLIRALEQCAEILGDSPMDQSAFADLFRLVLSQYDVGTIPVSLDSVGLGDMGRMRRRDVKHLLVLGATDDRLPAVLEEPGLLTESDRETLRSLGLRLSESEQDKLSRELGLIYNAFTMATEQLILFYPQSDGQSEKRPSYLVRRILRLFGKRAEENLPVLDRAYSRAACFDLALEGGKSPESAAASAYFMARGGAEKARLGMILNRAAYRSPRLSPDMANALYGESPALSASRVDAFSACPFRHFLQYGLRARPRRPAEFDAPAAGLFLHDILENVTRDIKAAGGFQEAEPELWKRLARDYTARYVRERLFDFKDKNDRFRYLFRRLSRDVEQVVEDMARELARSEFVPLDFELRFGPGGVLPPVALEQEDIRLSINGAVDRLDGWVNDGKLYLRVVDYKTGKRTFKLSDVWYGMGMQMLIYLFALCKSGEARYGAETILPAGVLYAPARDAMVPASPALTDGEIEALRLKELKRSGILLRDPDVLRAMENASPTDYIPVTLDPDGAVKSGTVATLAQMGALARHIEKTLLSIGRAMKAGEIAPAPCAGSVPAACDWCEYKSVCRLEAAKAGRRYLPALKDEAVLVRMGESEERPKAEAVRGTTHE